MLDFLTNKKALKLIDQLAEPFKNLPHLPQGVIDFLVGVAPWLVGIGGVFSLLGALSNLRAAFGMSPAMEIISQYTTFNSTYFIIMAVLQLAMAWLAFQAFTPLKEKKAEGWIFIFWSNILSVAQTIVSFAYSKGSIMGVILSILIGFYILFELRSAYNGQAEAKVEKKTEKKAKKKTAKKSAKKTEKKE